MDTVDQPISHGIKERLSYLPPPCVTRCHPYEEIKEMFEKHRQEAKQKAFMQHQRHTRKYDVLEVRKGGRALPRKLPGVEGFV